METLTRRRFTATALAAGSYSRLLGANDRLRIGVIGCGGMATGHMRGLLRTKEQDNTEIVAVCDVYEKHLQQAAQLTGGKPYKDYRTVLDNKDVDYVLIATPEHWHFPITMDAAAAGKHIYCEKPMTRTIEQSKKVVARIGQAGVKMQVGVQGMSDDSYETAHRYIQEGVLGKIVICQIDYSRNHTGGDFWTRKPDPDVRPGENLDWKTWLGQAPKRPYDPDRFFCWRRYWDYSSGIASDLFIHRVTRIIKACGLTFPERAVATGGKYEFIHTAAEIPDTMNILLQYPGGPDVLLVSSMANDTAVDHVIRGHKATLHFTRTGFVIRPQREFAKEMKEIVHEKTGAESTELHHRNLHNAIRKNEPLKCDCRLGYYGVVACGMGVQSMRKRQYVAWDKAKERVVRA
ncbi:MAG: Gfo/Idh/MocA family oxidoreductase [Candidatus Solibacter usitatus]|nr:Gfo/Idh/MocA family oxidoreductase [Candidatus Solibacter usitatus]